jgi:hypothetical protein
VREQTVLGFAVCELANLAAEHGRIELDCAIEIRDRDIGPTKCVRAHFDIVIANVLRSLHYSSLSRLKKRKKNSAPDRSRLALSAQEMRKFGYAVVDLLADHFANLKDGPVGAKGDPAKLVPLFDVDPPENGRDPNELLAQLERSVFPNNLHVDHPRFFAFVPGPNNFVSTMADALAAGFNIFNGTWFGGSAAAAVELGVVGWLGRTCGFPETSGGLFVSGGSMANLTALVAARNALLRDRVDGATVYFSDQTHSSVQRALHVIGFLPEQMRKLPSDEDFRLSIETLRAAIAADRAQGLRPFCIVANAGTTNTGAIDPLPELSDFAAAEKMWLHIDGALAQRPFCPTAGGRCCAESIGRIPSRSIRTSGCFNLSSAVAFW